MGEALDPYYVRWFKRSTYILRMLVGYSAPLFCVPLIEVDDKSLRCLYVLIVTYEQLLFGTVHPGVASFLPFVYLPLLEIDTMSEVCNNYFTELFFTCFGQLAYTAAMTTSGLCHRLALWSLRHMAYGIELGIFTLMAVSMAISFWVDNAIATLTTVSVVNETFGIIQRNTYIRMTQDASFRELNMSSSNSGEDNIPITEELADEFTKLDRMRQTSLIGVGFCATLGGMGLLSGHVINYYLLGYIREEYGSLVITPLSWCVFHLPLCFMLLVATWAVLHYLALGNSVASRYREHIDEDLQKAIDEQVEALGPLKLHEGGVLLNYILLNALLFLGSRFTHELSKRSGIWFSHSALWVGFTIVLFVFPAESMTQCDRGRRLLTWTELNNSMPWYTLLLANTCVLLSTYFRTTGLQQLMRDEVYERSLPRPLYVQIIISVVTSVMCELCQNTVVVAIFAPYVTHLDCRGAFPIVKCTYCRTEFQQESGKLGTVVICKKCEQNVKAYGKPTACEYCNIIAAFIGSKCQRCTNSEKRYGPPVSCEQCKQRCAFDRKDDSRRKVEGKLLCWLCTLSYKRAVAKTKHNDPMRHTALGKATLTSHHSHHHHGHHHHGHHHHRSSSGSAAGSTNTASSAGQNHHHHRKHSHSSSSLSNHKVGSEHGSVKRPRLDPAKLANGSTPLRSTPETSGLLDPNSSDHVVVLTQLREQVSSLQKQLSLKDQQLLAKDKQIAELKAHMSSDERNHRSKLQAEQKKHSEVVQDLTNKLLTLQKQIAAKAKSNRKNTMATDSPSSLIT
ncbi:Na(+)/dicarboxylate cotransporter 3 [Dermacentor andersoni]|uniref:Na(+)/dicarboxylate cotransporter 3 n=1 Tax=Dermacentor andersoni TaxID=34620 RepID=UPI002417FA4B|nr:Na(+)/dicarboxylate cotransporter 3-like [Dermacentor andersoni]